MARSSDKDPLDKFRFKVTIFANDTASGGFTTGGLASSSSIGTTLDSALFNRSGFSEVTNPKATIKDISYRENIHGNDLIKVPGLVTYDPVVLRRGVTSNFDLYNWYKQVNNSAASLNKFQQALSGFATVPFQRPNYRREVLISTCDRAGNFVKHWLLYNAWPNSYKGGNDFDAKTSEVLLEEISLMYETFLECDGDTELKALQNAQKQSDVAAQKAAIASLIGLFT